MKNSMILEKTIKGMVRQLEATPLDVMIAVSNAFYHGEEFPAANWGKEDENLHVLYDGIEKSLSAAKKASW